MADFAIFWPTCKGYFGRDGIIRIFREGMGMVFCIVWAWWFVNRVPGNKLRFAPRAAKLERADWKAFLGVRYN